MSRPLAAALDSATARGDQDVDFAAAARNMAWAADVEAGLAAGPAPNERGTPKLEPGDYAVEYGGARYEVQVGEDGIATLSAFNKTWRFRLAEGARGWRAADAAEHDGNRFESNHARSAALRALKRAHGVR